MAEREVNPASGGKPVQGKDATENKKEKLLEEKKLSEGTEVIPDAEQLSDEKKSAESTEAISDVEQLLGVEKSAEGTENVSDAPHQESGKVQQTYKITCRNQITKQIGGVDFKDGVGHTSDGYAASWFASKDGYTVRPVE